MYHEDKGICTQLLTSVLSRQIPSQTPNLSDPLKQKSTLKLWRTFSGRDRQPQSVCLCTGILNLPMGLRIDKTPGTGSPSCSPSLICTDETKHRREEPLFLVCGFSPWGGNPEYYVRQKNDPASPGSVNWLTCSTLLTGRTRSPAQELSGFENERHKHTQSQLVLYALASSKAGHF